MKAERLRATTEIDDSGQVRVLLPKGMALPSQELFVERIGGTLILTAPDVDPCDLMKASLSMFTDDFMEHREQPVQGPREEFFE